MGKIYDEGKRRTMAGRGGCSRSGGHERRGRRLRQCAGRCRCRSADQEPQIKGAGRPWNRERSSARPAASAIPKRSTTGTSPSRAWCCGLRSPANG